MDTPICKLPGCLNPCYLGKNNRYKLHCSKKCCAIDNAAKSMEKRKENNIKKYGTPFPISLPSVKDKIKESVKSKYGVENVSQILEVKNKKKDTLINNYGVDSPLKSSEIKDRAKKTYLQNYNVEHVSYIGKTQEQINLLKDVSKIVELNQEFNLYSISKQYGFSDRTLREILQNNDIEPIHHSKSSFEREIKHFIKCTSSFEIKECVKFENNEIDLFISELKLGFECNGAYWHSELAGNRKKDYHKNKTEYFQNLGIRIIHIWDYQWYQQQSIIKSIIHNLLGNSTRIYARKCEISLATKEEEIRFLNTNHIQGYVPSHKAYCLKINNDIVSMMSFKKTRFDKSVSWELLRFCNKLFTTVTGGASKMLKAFLSENNNQSIISYSHRHFSDGNLYKTLGFDRIRTTHPSYYYTKDYKKFYNRMTFQKHKLQSLLKYFDNQLTEWENMKNNGYDRIWDCGNDVWVLNKEKNEY